MRYAQEKNLPHFRSMDEAHNAHTDGTDPRPGAGRPGAPDPSS